MRIRTNTSIKPTDARSSSPYVRDGSNASLLATAAKTKVKQAIKKQLGHEADNLDFVVETNGSIRVYENLVEKTPRATSRTADLSDKF